MRLIATILAASALVAPAAAFAAPVSGGTTVVRVLVPLGDAVPGVLGTATVRSASPLDILFPITGGDVEAGGTNGATGMLFHEGSGFSITFGADVAEIRNLVIDATAGVVFGDLTINGSSFGDDLDLFTLLGGVTFEELTDLDNPLIQLNLTQTSVDALATFGVATDTDQRFGTAATGPVFAEVPAPAALALFGLGIVGLGFRRR